MWTIFVKSTPGISFWLRQDKILISEKVFSGLKHGQSEIQGTTFSWKIVRNYVHKNLRYIKKKILQRRFVNNVLSTVSTSSVLNVVVSVVKNLSVWSQEKLSTTLCSWTQMLIIQIRHQTYYANLPQSGRTDLIGLKFKIAHSSTIPIL